MKHYLLFAFIAAALTIAIIINAFITIEVDEEESKTPNDWFFMQRAYPYPEINYTARNEAWSQAQQIKAAADERGEGWVLEGPYNIGGRISAVAMHPSNLQTIYAGAASGGIFKSTDIGDSWTPIFEEALSLSIGDIAIAPSDPDVIWVGTGEANAGGGSMSYDGFGVYKSDNAGINWQHAGLENTGSIGRLAVDPVNPEICYVAAMGRLFSNNPDRGIFRTRDGGSTWQKVLYVNDSVGGIDIVIHPDHPDTLYACMWQRVRRPDIRNYGGTGCGIYRSYNGGDSWTMLSGGLPVNSPSNGRIGIDISQSDPNILYAIYADNIGYFAGVYKTTNGGNNWTRTSDSDLADMYSSYGWWFGRISIDPTDPDVAYAIGFDLYKTSDGGSSWPLISSTVHVDHHDLVAHAQNPSLVFLGNDGGMYRSYNGGSSWAFLDNLPITQFYTCEMDYQHPERLYGGTQDNGTNRTYTGGTSDWLNIYWGDGFYVLVDPTDNNFIYAEYQYGNFARSTNGGVYFSSAMSGISSSDRKNWCTPFVIDPINPQVLYYGANRLYKSTNRAVSWQVSSPDMTNGNPGTNAVYGTITTISVSPVNNQVIYTGTDDGNVWMTSNGGTSWTNISAALPERWVTRVTADPNEDETVYVTLSGYRYDSYLPHVFRSPDAGATWQDITGNLPDAPANDIIVDPALDSTLYLATDFGVYVTRDLGQNWDMLGDNLPNVPIVDMKFHQPTRTLIAATYGRSMYSFNIDQLVSVNALDIKNENIIIRPNPVKGLITFECNTGHEKAGYSVIDMNGKEVLNGSLLPGRLFHEVDAGKLSSGSYFLRITCENKVFAGKFIKL
jgi:photosystem II stability/assembly factor-like uncharacterized protein